MARRRIYGFHDIKVAESAKRLAIKAMTEKAGQETTEGDPLLFTSRATFLLTPATTITAASIVAGKLRLGTGYCAIQKRDHGDEQLPGYLVDTEIHSLDVIPYKDQNDEIQYVRVFNPTPFEYRTGDTFGYTLDEDGDLMYDEDGVLVIPEGAGTGVDSITTLDEIVLMGIQDSFGDIYILRREEEILKGVVTEAGGIDADDEGEVTIMKNRVLTARTVQAALDHMHDGKRAPVNTEVILKFWPDENPPLGAYTIINAGCLTTPP